MQETKINRLKKLLSKIDNANSPENSGGCLDLLPPLKCALEQRYYPLSSAQKRLFILNELTSDQTVYNLPFALQVFGQLDIDKMKNAFQRIVERHDALRSTFEIVDGTPVQIIHEQMNWQLAYRFDRNFDIINGISAWVKPFELKAGPLFRIEWIETGSQNSILLFDIHHIIADAKSLSILIEELTALYAELPLIPLKINYRDYAVWQNELLSCPHLLKQKDYWIKEFSDALPILHLPTDFPPSGRFNCKGDRLFLTLDQFTTTALRSLAKESKTSLYMVLLSLYATLLHRYTLDEEIIIGSSIEGRPEKSLKNIMGVFINALAIKCQAKSDKTFKSLLLEVRQTCLDAFQNQLFPFEELANTLAPQRNLNQNPIFQTLFDFHKAGGTIIDLKNLSLEYLPIQHKTSKFDLSLEATEHENYLELFFEFNTDLFKNETIQRLADSFVNITQHISQNPDAKMEDIPLFTKEKQNEIFSIFDSIDHAIPHDTSFQNLFKKQLIRFPDKIAAEDDHLSITYSQLDVISTHLSNHLRKMGILPGDVVATCMERSIDLLICMLSIFKSGTAYLPIDPEYPLSRANAILKESQAKILLSNKKVKSRQDYLLDPINIHELISFPAFSLPHLDVPADMLAYLIFTSGSTGNPKGAMLTHRGMINHIYSKIKVLGLTEYDVIAQTSSQTFDVSIWQFLTLLLLGGKIVVFNQENAWSPSPLLKELERKKITIFETVPSHMQLILDVLDEYFPRLGHLRYLILNGETLPVKICEKWQNYYPSIPIVNAYGPTECSDDICHYLIKEQDVDGKDTLPIGSMIANLKGYILNSSLSLMPPHVPGEFYAGGVGIGRGYVGRPDLTAEIFIPSPFGQKGERLYRTKDLAQYYLDGNIHYVGRVDRQIKIQGVRIELEEIESLLKKHPLVQQAAVLIKKDSTSKEILAAYIIPEKKEENQENLTANLRGYLKQKLPASMMPHTWMYLHSFPLNASGKINTKALPDPIQTDSNKQDFIPPETKTEKQITALWERLLKINPIGKQDHFFEKGGNSLLAIQYATEIRQRFAVEMPLHEIFSHPTLSEQAAYLDNRQKTESSVRKNPHSLPLVKADLSARYEPFQLTSVQHAYWLGRSGIFELGHVSVHVYTEYEKDGLNIPLLEKALNKLIKRHEALRLIFPGDSTQQILEQVPYYSIKQTDLSQTSQQEIEAWTADKRHQLSHEVFPSNVWPLFSVEAVLFPNNKVRLYLSFDALILDGWSINILFLEWKRWYDDIDTILPHLELSFRDYVLTLKQIKEAPFYQRDRDYWLSRIETFPLTPPLPLVSSSTSIKIQKFSRCTHRLPKTLWNKCQKHLKTFGLSPTAFIAATFSEVLAKYSGSEHFILNLTLFDRLPLHPQINDIAGDFTSIILLEVNRNELLFESFLKRAKALQKQLWQDLDHHLYSGIEFLRELGRHYKELPLGSLAPVVLTSILGVEDNDYDIQQFLGKEIFGISQTPQVWLDYKAYEIEGDLVIEWDYVNELFAPGFISAMHANYCHLLTLLATHDNLVDGKDSCKIHT